MNFIESRMNLAINEFDMHFYEDRLETFKEWPFKEKCNCTPEKLAAAGFVYCGTEKEPDLVKCYVCLKELDGWEPEDDPWNEHVSHAGYCSFIKFQNQECPTVKDFLELDNARLLNQCMKGFKQSNSLWTDWKNNMLEKLVKKEKL